MRLKSVVEVEYMPSSNIVLSFQNIYLICAELYVITANV